MSEPAIPGALSAVDRLVVSLVAGINMRALYGAEHPALASHVERIIEAVTAACEERQRDSLTFLVVGTDLVVETQPLRTGSLYHQQFIRALTRRGVERLTVGARPRHRGVRALPDPDGPRRRADLHPVHHGGPRRAPGRRRRGGPRPRDRRGRGPRRGPGR